MPGTGGERTAAANRFHQKVTKMAEDSAKADEEVPVNRLRVGAAIFVIGHLAPLAIPIVSASSLSASWKTVLSGLMFFGIPEVSTLLAVIVLGRAGFNLLKSLLFKWAGQTLLPEKVSRPRYYTGLVLFLIPFFIGWVTPYLHEAFPDLIRHQLIVAISGDATLIVGLFLMGGQFWDKLRALFICDSQLTFPSAVKIGSPS